MEEDILGGPAGGPDELRAIVARADRHRRRSTVTLAGIVAAAALAAGGGIGYAVSGHGSGNNTVVAGTQAGGSGAQTSPAYPSSGKAGAGPAIATEPDLPVPMGYGRLTRVFSRTVGAVTVRGFTTGTAPGSPSTSTSGSCPMVVDRFRAEISSPSMVGVTDAAYGPMSIPPGASILSVVTQRIGTAEGAPVDVVMVETTSAVTTVKVAFSGSPGVTDQMTPVQGWAVLVDAAPASPKSAPVATVTALGAGGRVLATRTTNMGTPFPMPMPPEGRMASPWSCACASSGTGYVTPNQPQSGPPAPRVGGSATAICAKPVVPVPVPATAPAATAPANSPPVPAG